MKKIIKNKDFFLTQLNNENITFTLLFEIKKYINKFEIVEKCNKSQLKWCNTEERKIKYKINNYYLNIIKECALKWHKLARKKVHSKLVLWHKSKATKKVKIKWEKNNYEWPNLWAHLNIKIKLWYVKCGQKLFKKKSLNCKKLT